MEELNELLSYLQNPVIRFGVIGAFSTAFAGVYVLKNKVGNFKYDTITDLKKKAKSFNKVNYQQSKNNKSKSGF